MTQKSKRAANDLAVEIRVMLPVVTKLTMRDLEQRVNAAIPGSSLLQYGVMRILWREECTLSEISAKMMLTPSTLVPVVDKLEREGLVVRGKDPSDRRRTPLMLTDKAIAVLESIPTSHPNDAIVKAVSSMGDTKAKQLHKLLHELITHLSPDRDVITERLANHPDNCLPRAIHK